MLALIQRVTRAQVRVDAEVVGAIGTGLLVLVCAEPQDGEAQADKLLGKLLRLRIFPDAQGRMNRSLQDVQGGLLLVSQFTLAADLRSGTRPGFSHAAPPELARRLYEYLLAQAHQCHASVASGVFGAHMQVELLNDGPVTIPLKI
ncbi:D-tyrosyl-tRNA(Tyr) deacylase [Corticibacter populi]|uniref:D-aminoacyl-tRNA deacylase n=1 Tax=Corticibacter populi TaxID=1550736 RepID=A0A3M6QZK9_9BURK|nr:D-aminoacyl-tRNA deacylase [Corticibacter populi]RMX08385.1 D-tyrosyl-tRNA(Tyr) deacylase [Corticibacter populi]RZS35687.1 D-tyrosyl-tRNA(Tyr) deacylase [Corticibacter populi]